MASLSLNDINKFMNADTIECQLCDKRFYGMAAFVRHPCRDDKLDKYKNFTNKITNISKEVQIIYLDSSPEDILEMYRRDQLNTPLVSGGVFAKQSKSGMFYWSLLYISRISSNEESKKMKLHLFWRYSVDEAIKQEFDLPSNTAEFFMLDDINEVYDDLFEN